MKQRFIYGGLAAVIFMALLLWGGPLFYVLLALMAVIGYSEFVRISQIGRGEWIAWIGGLAVLGWVTPWTAFLSWERLERVDLTLPGVWLLLLAVFTATVVTKNRFHVGQAALIITGALYVAIGFGSMITLHQLQGAIWTLMIFGCIWMTDIGAYLTGRWVGKHKLWPAISPNKTIEGAFGGIALTVATGLVFQGIYDFAGGWWEAIFASVVISIVAQLGDFIQSAYKRHAGVKDSGKILPGHGGILDRCDSWLTVFPMVLFFVY